MLTSLPLPLILWDQLGWSDCLFAKSDREERLYFNRPQKITSNDFSSFNSHKCSQHNNIRDAILLVYIIAIIACPRQAKFSVNYLAAKCARKSIKVWVAEDFTIQCRVSGQTYQITASIHSISRNNCRQHLATHKYTVSNSNVYSV